MISYERALAIVRAVGADTPMETEFVAIERAVGRVTATSITSPEAVPPFDNSAMDGFAVRATSTEGATETEPVRLEVLATLGAGEALAVDGAASGASTGAVEIMTGAALPPGYDSVIRLEDVVVERDGRGQPRQLRIVHPSLPGAFLRARASDFEPGQEVVTAGTVLAPRHVMALAAVGIERVPVRRLPRVALLSTGRELVAPGAAALGPSQIRNSTAPFLLAAFAEQGIEARFYGIVRDEPAEFRRLIGEMRDRGTDIIVSTGAVSVGKYDFVAASLAELGATPLFHRCAIRPGKPLLFSRLGPAGPVFFGVPGNPVATAVGKRFFIDAYQRAHLRLPAEVPKKATLIAATAKPEGLRCFFKARFRETAGQRSAECLQGQGSHLVGPLVNAHGWVELEEAGPSAAAGITVNVYPLTDRGEDSSW
jgi:molybdopterin molybdotransferase